MFNVYLAMQSVAMFLLGFAFIAVMFSDYREELANLLRKKNDD